MMDYETEIPVDDLEAVDEDEATDLGDGWIRPPLSWSCPRP
jgi:hypothetical protein